MPNSKQKVRDRDYYGEYQKKSCYTVEQWEKIISNEAFVSPTELAILKEIFLSANHAASLSQLSFRHKKDTTYFLDKMNQLASNIGRPNGYAADSDLDGNDYWWYLLFWGKNTKLAGLEWKLIPELAEAIEYSYPELEDQYNTYMSEIERSEQIRYTKEDSVWIASALLLFEKVYLEHPTDIYDLLLMQYEVSQRSQKIYGQDVDVDIITDNCNADSPRCVFPYLRDIDKYWRVCYPGEIEDAVLRPEKIDYNAYVPSKFGFIKIKELCDFLETDYCKLTDPNYVEIDESNPFYQMIHFIRENGRRRYMDLTAPTEEDIERFLRQKEQGKEALQAFHSIGDLLTSQYPSFTQTEKASWLEKDNTTIKNCWIDSYETSEYNGFGPSISILCGQSDEQKGKIMFAVLLTFPIESPELTDQVMEKCGNLAVLTSADFHVDKTIRMDTMYSTAFGNAVAAYTSFEEQSVLEEPVQDVWMKFETAIQILASYYLDICESVYLSLQAVPEEEHIQETTDPASTVGSSDVPVVHAAAMQPAVSKRYTAVSDHSDRKDTSFTLYPNNILIQGSVGTGKTEHAIRLCTGILDGIAEADILKEPYADVRKRFDKYQSEGRILFSGNAGLTYEDWMEGTLGEGCFSSFSNHAADGRYVCLIEELDSSMLKEAMKDAYYLIGETKREGQTEYQTVSLLPSMRSFSIPSNLYFVGTTSTPYSSLEQELLHAFHVRHLEYDENALADLIIKGYPVGRMLSTINRRISYLIGTQYQLGHKIFDPIRDQKSLEVLGQVMYDTVLPLLLAAFSSANYPNPYEGAYYVLGDYKKSKPKYQFLIRKPLTSSEIFGGDLNFEEKEQFHVQKNAFFEQNSYLEL